MGRFLLTFSYIGTGFSGLQKNTNANLTIVGVLEDVLETWLNAANPIKLVSSSRTDRGVHALGNTTHVDLEHRHKGYQYNPLIITSTANKALMLMKAPLRVLRTQRVTDDFHARFNAVGRTYIYRIATFRTPELAPFTNAISPFDYQRVFPVCYQGIDMDKITRCAQLLSGTHDFSAFTADTRLQKEPWLNPVKTMEVSVERSRPFMPEHQPHYDFDNWELIFRGSSFLYKQVRKMVAVMLAVGTGRLTLDAVQLQLSQPEEGTVSSCGMGNLQVPPHALYLKEVHYKKQDLIPPDDDCIIDDTPIPVETRKMPKWVQRRVAKANMLKLDVPKPHAHLKRRMERLKHQEEHTDKPEVSQDDVACEQSVGSDTSSAAKVSAAQKTVYPENPSKDANNRTDRSNDT